MTRISSLYQNLPDLTSYVSAFTLAALCHGYDAWHYTGEKTKQSLNKTKHGINTISEYVGLLKPAFRTVAGIGSVVDLSSIGSFDFPDHWTKHHIIAGEQEVTYAEAMVTQAIGTYIFAIGHGTESAYYQPWIDRANNLGFNVIAIELPEPENNEEFANGDSINLGYKKIIADTILNSNAPIFHNIPNWHPVTLVTHSASGEAFEINIKEDVEKAKFAARYNHIFHTGIMLDTANSSDHHFPLSSAIYKKFSQLKHVRDKKLGSTEIDRYWIKTELEVSNKDYMFEIQSNPTHGQARRLKEAGIKHTTDVKNKNGLTPEFMSLKRTIIMGAEETGACILTAKDYANEVDGIDYIAMNNAKHNPLMECSGAYALISRTTLHSAKENLNRIRHDAQLKAATAPWASYHLSAPQAA